MIVEASQHPRYYGTTRPVEITVDTDDDSGTLVVVSVELGQGEHVTGPPAPNDRADYLALGDMLERHLTPAEARELAAALVHHADQAERHRR